jgi:tetratricopeptide (TPR) repeat protein
VAALDDWASEDWQLESRLLPIALRASDDPWRRQYFDARLRRDLPELLRLGRQPESAAQPAGIINNFARRIIRFEPSSAVQLLKDAQRQNPADVWLNYSLAEALGASAMRGGGSWEEGVAYRRAALALRPDSPALHIQLGWALSYAGHYEEAVAIFQKSLRLRHDDFFPYYGLGFAYSQLGRLNDALAAYQKALPLSKDQAHTQLALIGVLERQGAPEATILSHLAACRQALRLADSYGNDLAASIADLFAKHGKTDEAIAVLLEAIRHEPSLTQNEDKLYHLLTKTGRIEKSLVEWRAQMARRSTDIGTYRLLGVVAEKEGRWDEAIDAWRQVVRSKPSASTWIHLGRVLANAKQNNEAIQAYREALRMDPMQWYVHNRIGQALEQAGRLDEALEAYRAALRANPASADDLEQLFNLLARTGRLDAAMPDVRRIIRLQLSSSPSPLAQGQRFEGKALDLAISVYREAIGTNTEDGLLHNALARALQKKGLFDEAKTAYQDVFRLRPNDVPLHLAFGQQFEEKGRADLALPVYQQALRGAAELSPPLRMISGADFNKNAKPVELLPIYRAALACLSTKSGGNYTSLGDVLAKAGLLDEAIAAWREGARLQPTNIYGQQQLGLGLEKKGLVPEALAAYREALRTWPELPPVLQRLLGDQFAKNAKPDELLPIYRVAMSCLSYKSGGNYGSLGDALAKLNLLDEAVAAWRETIRLEPNYLSPRQKLAAALEKQGLAEEAAAAWREVIRLDPKYISAYTQLAGLLLKAGKLDEAICIKADYAWAQQICDLLQSKGLLGQGIAAAREGIRHRPTEASFHIVLGLALERQLQWEEALTVYSEWVRLQPKSSEALVRRAGVYHRLGRDDDALADLTRATDVAPTEPSAWSARAQFQVGRHRWDEAAADFSKVIELNLKDIPSWLGRANAYVQLKQWDKAAADYSELILLNPTNSTVWLQRGNAFSKLGQFEKAIADNSRAIELSPTLRQAWIDRAFALSRLGRWDKASTDYSEAIRLEPRDASAWHKRAECHVHVGHFREAIADDEEAVRLSPTAAPFHNTLAWLLATCPDVQLRDPRRAVEVARKAVELAPRAGTFWNTLGAAHYRAGDWDAAVSALAKSMELRKDGDAFDWFFLAMAHRKLGHGDEARKWYDRALHWLEQNREALEKDSQHAEELRRFRREAEEVLELKKG